MTSGDLSAIKDPGRRDDAGSTFLWLSFFGIDWEG